MVAAVLTLIGIKNPNGAFSDVSFVPAAIVPSFFSENPLRRLKAILNIAGFVLLIFGALCLFFDLGRIDKVLLLFLSPTFSYLSIGAYFLLATILFSAGACVFDIMQFPFNVSKTAIGVFTAFCIVVSLGTMTYTGLLLTSLTQVHLWNSGLIVVLFVLSSLSCGLAATMVVGVFEEIEEVTVQVISVAVKIDTVLITLEIIGALVWCVLTLSVNTYAQPAANNLFLGGNATLSGLWWAGFIACGAIAPLIIEIVLRVRLAQRYLINDFDLRKKLLATAGVLIVVGAFCMRCSIVEAGQSRIESTSQIVLEQAQE